MAALPAGVAYNLLSESMYSKNKELVYVKLTDSALKTIEDYLQNNKNLLDKPKIQFLPGNKGKIIIPTSNKTANEGVYYFSEYKKEETQQDGKLAPVESQECIRQCGPQRLESCGQFQIKLRVQATNNSYEATKNRMAKTVATEQSKCTQVIEPNRTDIGRRVKVRSSHPVYSSSSAAAERIERVERSERPESTEKPERIERIKRAELDKPERLERVERPDRPERPATAPLVTRPQASQADHEMHQPMHQQSHPQRAPPNPKLLKRPLKERLIQLLALKSFKKPEIYARLNREGLKNKERSNVNKILNQITSLKDNCYQLRRHVWNDVNEDWPFYTEEEKRMLKGRKPQDLTRSLISDSTNSLSPRATKRTSACLSNNSYSNGANTGALSAEDVPALKKKRISHYQRPSPPSSGYTTGSSGASSAERHPSDNEDDRPNTVKKDNAYTLNINTEEELCQSLVKPRLNNGYRNSPTKEASNNSAEKKDITNSKPLENPDNSLVPSENEIQDLYRQYPRITSVNKKQLYMNDFTDLYSEYIVLYRQVEEVATRFTFLEQEYRNAQNSGGDQQKVETVILEEYKAIRSNPEYISNMRRVHYYDRKLNHIKQMVYDFDKEQSLKPERVSAASTPQVC